MVRGEREIIYLSVHCHHQNDFCIKMGSDESHFNVSVGSDGQSHKTVSTNHNLFEEKGSLKRYRTEVIPLTRLIRDGGQGGGGYGGGGERDMIYLSLHRHHQNDSCTKMGSEESHFNVSLIARDKATRQCPQTTTFEEKGEPKRIPTEVPLLTSLTPYREAKPALNVRVRMKMFQLLLGYPPMGVLVGLHPHPRRQ